MLVLENSKKIFVENESLEGKRFERKRREDISSFADSGEFKGNIYRERIVVEKIRESVEGMVKDLKEKKERS